MRILRVSVFMFVAAILFLIGMTPQCTFAAQVLQQRGPSHAARLRASGRQAMRLQIRPQQSGPTPALVATPALFQDKEGLNGTGAPFVVPVTNVSPTETIQVSGISADNNLFTVSTTCTTVAPGGTCTMTISAATTDLCESDVADVTLASNDPAGPLVVLVDVYGADNNFNITSLVNGATTAAKLAASLVGTGVTISNATYTGAAVAAGTFSTTSNIIGFDNGIILSSGTVRNVIGPNCDSGITAENMTAGDTDLSSLIGQVTNDAAVLEFDFIPTNPTIRFQYVFASDEYEDFVFDFNDVFAFFVNGKNVALIPGTNTLVSINTVNDGNNGRDAAHPEYALIPPVNPQFYVNNDIDVFPTPPFDTEMDGFTVVLTASAPVNPGVTNHIKLAIADALDFKVDSNVFIKAGSLSSSVVSLAPTGLAFGNVNQGSQGTAQTVTLTNVGSAALSGVSVAADSNNFTTANNTCGATVAAGASCTIDVNFTPQSGGVIQGSLNFTDSAGDSPQPVSLSGTGISGPFVSFSPTSLAFGPETVENTSPPQTVTITNTGTSLLTIGSVNAITLGNTNNQQDFSITQETCISGSIPVGQSCTVTLTWTNLSTSLPEAGQLIVQDNAPGGQQIVGLVGGITISTISVSQNALAFGNQVVNTTSAVKTIVINNTGTALVTIPSIVVPAGFAETDNCISSGGLVPTTSSGQTSCTINVTFTPTSATTFGGVLTIGDSAQGNPHTVTLSGTGIAATLVSIAVTPNPATVAVNGQLQFTATGTFSDQTTKDVTAQSTWTSSATETAMIGANTGLATGGSAPGGPITITATDGTITGTAQLTVTGSSVTLKSIAVTPNPVTIAVNGMQQFTATGTFSDNSTKDVTAQSHWTSSNTEVASIGAATGLATGVGLGGPVTITATDGNIVGTAQLTVSNSPITITITPPPSGTFGPVPPGGMFPVGGVITAVPGTNGTVTFSCTTSSVTITCQPRPASITITSNGPTQVAFVVNTFCKGTTSSGHLVWPGGSGGGLGLLMLAMTLAGFGWMSRRNPRWVLSFALFSLIALGGVACNSLPRGPNGATPPGTYTLTITATFNGQSTTAATIQFVVD
jgi:hypothetical protein